MFPVLRQFGLPIGVEESWEALRDLDDQAVGKIVQGSVEALPFPDRTFHLITALDVLEHLDNDRAVLSEFHRLCTDDGFLLVTVPAFRFLWGPQDKISHHRRRYTAKDLGSRVEASGFSVVRLNERSLHCRFPRWRRREGKATGDLCRRSALRFAQK